MNHVNGTPAAIARLIITWACRGLVVNSTCSAMPVARKAATMSSSDTARSRRIPYCAAQPPGRALER